MCALWVNPKMSPRNEAQFVEAVVQLLSQSYELRDSPDIAAFPMLEADRLERECLAGVDGLKLQKDIRGPLYDVVLPHLRVRGVHIDANLVELQAVAPQPSQHLDLLISGFFRRVRLVPLEPVGGQRESCCEEAHEQRKRKPGD